MLRLMSDNPLKTRIEQRLSELNISARAASLKAGASADLLRPLLDGRTESLRQSHLQALAPVLKTTVNWLITGSYTAPETETQGLPEIDVRGGAGGGGMVATSYARDEDGNNVEVENIVATWSVPPAYLRGELRVDPKSIHIIEVLGDSMTPSLQSGDRVFIDTRHKAPSPPGIYALHDGYGVIIKRIQLVPGTDPQRVLVLSDNPGHRETELTLEEAHIIGRVVARVTAL